MYLKDLNETIAAGEMIGRHLAPGDVILLSGDLGAGKTSLCQGIARGLGVAEAVTSPTFNLLLEYHSGRLPLYHMDAYRLETPEEAYEIGLEDLLVGAGVLLIEWPERISALLPEGAYELEMRRVEEGRALLLPKEMEAWFDDIGY